MEQNKKTITSIYNFTKKNTVFIILC